MNLVGATLVLLCSGVLAAPSAAPESGKRQDKPGEAKRQEVPIPLPVTITQDVAELDRIKESERLSREHDEKDLAAQVRAATAAERQITPAWWQAIGAAAAALLLVWTLFETRRTANAAVRQAQIAASEAQPFLHPVVTHFSLHPEVDQIRDNSPYTPGITLKFRNIGKSPALLHQIGLKLCLVERDNFGPPDPIDTFPAVLTSDVIASGEIGASRKWQHQTPIGLEETKRLAASAKQNNFMRFYVAGYVVYDDVFNVRHTRRFLLKIRQSGFQATRGGRPHNSVTQRTVPERELEGQEA